MVSFQYAKQFFDNAPDVCESLRRNPVTGAAFCPPDLKGQIERSRRPLAARAIFKLEVPWVWVPLPLSRFEWEPLMEMENMDYRYIVGVYGKSLASRNYKLAALPWFDEYAAGVLAVPRIGQLICSNMPELGLRYPPKVLPRLDWAGFYCDPRRPR
jgi:hypothetical protein